MRGCLVEEIVLLFCLWVLARGIWRLGLAFCAYALLARLWIPCHRRTFAGVCCTGEQISSALALALAKELLLVLV